MDKKSSLISYDKYERPDETLQDKLTEREIGIMLEDYIEVSDMKKVDRNTHIRYYTVVIENSVARKVFRIGGELKYTSEDGVFVVLSNGQMKWSVQTKNSIFYRQISINEIKKEYEYVIDEYEQEILDLKKILKKLYKKVTGKCDDMETSVHESKKIKESETKIRTSHKVQRNDNIRQSDKRPMVSARSSKKIGFKKKDLYIDHDSVTTEKHIRL
jgi:hypothetical protein